MHSNDIKREYQIDDLGCLAETYFSKRYLRCQIQNEIHFNPGQQQDQPSKGQ